jgi:hypothetical protein
MIIESRSVPDTTALRLRLIAGWRNRGEKKRKKRGTWETRDQDQLILGASSGRKGRCSNER